jgi:methionyl aminopeptidase
MNPDIMEYYIKAGRIASKVRNETLKTVDEGVKLLDCAKFAEDMTFQMGGKMAFPCNISVNEIASHYTPLYGKRKFVYGNLVKIDIGVHVNGYIADTAATIEIGTHNNEMLIKAAEKALDKAIKEIHEGVNTKRLGRIVENVIKSYGCNVVTDLTGHSVDRYTIHSGINIPSYSGAFFGNTLHAGDVIAVEPFTTYGRGRTKHGEARIFSLLYSKNNNNSIYQQLESQFNTLPFTSRWMQDSDKLKKIKPFLRNYPVLIESDGCPVAQAEHTIIVQKDGAMVITT